MTTEQVHRRQLTALLVEAHRELQRTRSTKQLDRPGILMQRQAQSARAMIGLAGSAVADAMEATANNAVPLAFAQDMTEHALQLQRIALENTDRLMTRQ